MNITKYIHTKGLLWKTNTKINLAYMQKFEANHICFFIDCYQIEPTHNFSLWPSVYKEFKEQAAKAMQNQAVPKLRKRSMSDWAL